MSNGRRMLTGESRSLIHFNTIQFIKKSAFHLQLSAITTSTACAIYHKFYRNLNNLQSLNAVDLLYEPNTIATAAIYLAGKTEEETVRIRDVINVCHKVLHPHTPDLDVDDSYWTLRASIVNCELLVVRMLGFQLTFKHPHKYLLHYLKSLNDWLPPGIVANVPIANTAWTLLNDIYHVDTCIRYKVDHIAVSVLYLSILSHGVSIPCAAESKIKWWEVLSDDITLTIIQEIISELIDAYELENKV